MPPLHPLIVHFPIVLSITAGVLYLVALLRRNPTLGKVAFSLHVAGLGMSVFAILTGDYEESRITQTPAIRQLVGLHETMAMVSTWGLGLLAVWAYLRQQANVALERLGFLLAFWAMIGLIGYSAHLGGALVFGHGAGVAPMQQSVTVDSTQQAP